jgi:hypothetical protein
MTTRPTTNWKKLIKSAMERSGDAWENAVATTIPDSELEREFDAGYGTTQGTPFLFWSKTRVYFAVQYDGSEWVESVPREPTEEKARHFGGG